MLPAGGIELLMRSGGGLERRINFEWLNGLIRTAARPPVVDSLALPFLAFGTKDGVIDGVDAPPQTASQCAKVVL
jgi:hypothetical protein